MATKSGLVGGIFIQTNVTYSFTDVSATLQADNKNLIINNTNNYGFVRGTISVKKDGNLIHGGFEVHYDRVIFLEEQTSGTYTISGACADITQVGGSFDYSFDIIRVLHETNSFEDNWNQSIECLYKWSASAKSYWLDENYISKVEDGLDVIVVFFSDTDEDKFYVGYGQIASLKLGTKDDGITNAEISFEGTGHMLSDIEVLQTTRNHNFLDVYSTNILFALSYYKVLSDYNSYCVRVRRSSDNTEMDFGFVGTYIDYQSILNFCGAGNGYVVTWYNQFAGNSPTNSSQSNQPLIVENGMFCSDGIKFTGVNKSCLYCGTYSQMKLYNPPMSLYLNSYDQSNSSAYQFSINTSTSLDTAYAFHLSSSTSSYRQHAYSAGISNTFPSYNKNLAIWNDFLTNGVSHRINSNIAYRTENHSNYDNPQGIILGSTYPYNASNNFYSGNIKTVLMLNTVADYDILQNV